MHLDLGLIELETTRPFFTWRCSHSCRLLMSRLDRALASEDFVNFWDAISVMVLPRVHSDHHPLLMKCQDGNTILAKPFRFQNFWTSHKDFISFVSESWNIFMPAKDPITVCIRKLKRLKVRLKEWSAQVFGNIFLRLGALQQELAHVQGQDNSRLKDDDCKMKERELMTEINEILKQQ